MKAGAPEIFRFLLRRDLAGFAGISTENTVKLLKTFEKDGLIELHKEDIKLINHKSFTEIIRRG